MTTKGFGKHDGRPAGVWGGGRLGRTTSGSVGIPPTEFIVVYPATTTLAVVTPPLRRKYESPAWIKQQLKCRRLTAALTGNRIITLASPRQLSLLRGQGFTI